MTAGDLSKHLVSIFWGLGACVAGFTLFSLAGRGLLALIGKRSIARPADSGGDGNPAILMMALYSLWCWYGVELGVRLLSLVWAFCAISLLLVAAAWPDVKRWLFGPSTNRMETYRWLFGCAVFYVIAYLFFTPSVSGANLPIVSYNNNDLLHYVDFTRALQNARSPNVAGMPVLTSQYYFGVPATYYALAFLATFFRMDPLNAAMPALFGVCALIALLVARISHAVFSVSRLWALVIGATVVSGPFFRYIAGNYFFPMLVGVPVVLHLILLTTTNRRAAGTHGIFGLAWRCAMHYVILLLMYPALLAVALTLQAAILGVMILAPMVLRSLSDSAQRRRVAQPGVAFVLGLALMTAAMPLHVATAARLVINQSQIGVAGWPLGFISPLALAGFPGSVRDVETGAGGHPDYVVALACVFIVLLVVEYFWRLRVSTTDAQRTWVAIGAGSLVAYWVYYLVVGRSYQQWKLASYLPLPLAFTGFAGAVRLAALETATSGRHARIIGRTSAVALPIALAAFFVGGNLRVHARDEPPLRRFAASFANLAAINEVKSFRDMYVEMGTFSDAFMPVYFIRNKQLHLVSESYYPLESLSLDRVSRSWPYFTANFDCDAVGHADVMPIPGVGCLLYDPPSPQLDVEYSFGRPLMFLKPLEGFSAPELWGRWTVGHVARLEIEGDSQRIPFDQNLYLNFLLEPYLPPASPHQRVQLSWHTENHGAVDLELQEWVSIPLDKSAWDGARVRKVLIRLDLPNAVAPSTVEASSERRVLGIAFLKVALSTTARGRSVR